MGLCLDGPPPHPLRGDNNLRLGLKVIVLLLCPRSPGLGPRSLRGYLIVDSLVSVTMSVTPLSHERLICYGYHPAPPGRGGFELRSR